MDILIQLLGLMLSLPIFFVFTYLKGRADNIARNKDLQKITKIVEDIKRENSEGLAKLAHQHNLEFQRLDQLNDLRLAAIDERLKAYQTAYSLVFRMLGVVRHRDDAIELLRECEAFWRDRSLYISEPARVSFDKAMIALNAAESTFQLGSPISPEENRKNITEALRVIERCVKLPEFTSSIEQSMIEN